MAAESDALGAEELAELVEQEENATGHIILEVETALDGGAWASAFDDVDGFVRAVLQVAAEEEHIDGEVSVLLADDSVIRALNSQWRQQDKPTNVLSFPSPQSDVWALGDIALAYETIANEAQEQGKSFPDHTAHLLVHGFLHLIDYDHIDDADAEKMEARERAILARLGIADPYSYND